MTQMREGEERLTMQVRERVKRTMMRERDMLESTWLAGITSGRALRTLANEQTTSRTAGRGLNKTIMTTQESEPINASNK